MADGGKKYRLFDLCSFTDEHFALHPWIKSLEEAGEDDYDSDYLFLCDGNTPVRYIAGDGGEPEDQTFRRNWSWVVRELNAALAAATKEDDRSR